MSNPIKVVRYSGFKESEAPLKFTLKGEAFVVKKILARWYERGMEPKSPLWETFKVIGNEAEVHILKHNLTDDLWEILSKG